MTGSVSCQGAQCAALLSSGRPFQTAELAGRRTELLAGDACAGAAWPAAGSGGVVRGGIVGCERLHCSWWATKTSCPKGEPSTLSLGSQGGRHRSRQARRSLLRGQLCVVVLRRRNSRCGFCPHASETGEQVIKGANTLGHSDDVNIVEEGENSFAVEELALEFDESLVLGECTQRGH